MLFANELTRRHQTDGDRGQLTASWLDDRHLDLPQLTGCPSLALAVRPFAKTIERGAATTVYCATAPELVHSGGDYSVDCQKRAATKEARDAQVAAELWQRTEALLTVAKTV